MDEEGEPSESSTEAEVAKPQSLLSDAKKMVEVPPLSSSIIDSAASMVADSASMQTTATSFDSWKFRKEQDRLDSTQASRMVSEISRSAAPLERFKAAPEMASGGEDARLRRKPPEEGRVVLDRRLEAEAVGSRWIGSPAPLTDLAANEEEGGGDSLSLSLSPD
ncbi:unnamed protein product [Linum trigynum]|uniref:Uncharacterized protein n=1 Tax=Linum trigynum TaxID=586398 RepID=A0AAV2E6E5_9ROSI